MTNENNPGWGIVPVEGQGAIPPQEDLPVLHSELLERAFATLDNDWQNGNAEAFEGHEAEFIRQFESYWKYRFQKYEAELKRAIQQPFLGGRLIVNMGEFTEELGFTHQSTPGHLKLTIFRSAKGGNEYDNLTIDQYSNSFTRKVSLFVNGGTTIENSHHPQPSSFQLSIFDNRIRLFGRTTRLIYRGNDGEERHVARTVNLGQFAGR